jgi:hypothetical protein
MQTEPDLDEVLDEVENNGANTRSDTILPEAPASINIKLWVDDYSVMLTMRSERVSDVIKQMEYVVTLAKKRGWKSTWDKVPSTPQTTVSATPHGQTNMSASMDAPFCPTHNRPMKKFTGKWGEFWKCTAKINESEWCSEKVNIKK